MAACLKPSVSNHLLGLLSKQGVRTHVVGSRASWARPLALATLAIGLALGGPSQAQDQPHAGAQASEVASQAEIDGIKLQSRVVEAEVDFTAVSTVIAVGINDQDVLDRQQLFSAWSAAGLGEWDAIELLEFAWTGGTYVKGVDGLNGDDPARIDRVFEFLGGDLGLAEPGAPVEWKEASKAWDRLVALEEFEPGAGDGVSMEDAMGTLEKATQAAGLASLRMPLSAMADPDRMLAYAKALENLNSDLSKVSGLEGQVLGLAGRVNLTIGLDRGLMKIKHRGMTSVYNDGDGLGIQGLMSTLVHEWGHGAQFSVERHVSGAPNPYIEPGSLIAQLERAAPQWVKGMHDHADREYLTSPEEMMARSFEMQVELQRKDLGLATATEIAHTPHVVSYPNLEQARAQSSQWNAWLSSIKPLNLTEPVVSVDTGLVHGALDQGIQAPAEPQVAQRDTGLAEDTLAAWRQAKKGISHGAKPALP